MAELYLGRQWFHYTDRGNCHSSKIIRAKLANGRYFLSHWRSHKRNTNKMSPQTQWLQDYRNLISHFINWVLWTWKTMGTEKHLLIGNTWNCQGACSIMNFFQVVKMGLAWGVEWLIKRVHLSMFLRTEGTFRELTLLLWIDWS